MYDLVHDLAMFVTGEVYFRFDNTMNFEWLIEKTRYISVLNVSKDHKPWRGRFQAKHLRTYKELGSYSFSLELDKEVLEGGRSIRVLSLTLKIGV